MRTFFKSGKTLADADLFSWLLRLWLVKVKTGLSRVRVSVENNPSADG